MCEETVGCCLPEPQFKWTFVPHAFNVHKTHNAFLVWTIEQEKSGRSVLFCLMALTRKL